MTPTCVSESTITGTANGLAPGQHQAIIWTNAGILSIGLLGTNFNEILIEIHAFLFKTINLKMLSGKWRPFCLGLTVFRKVCLHSMRLQNTIYHYNYSYQLFLTEATYYWHQYHAYRCLGNLLAQDISSNYRDYVKHAFHCLSTTCTEQCWKIIKYEKFCLPFAEFTLNMLNCF